MGKYWSEKQNNVDDVNAEDFNNAFNLIAEDMEKTQKTAGKAPYIGDNGNWYEWDSDVGEYVNTGIMAEGYTPVKGVDYWTEEDKAEIISEIPSGGTWTKLADITTTEEVNSIIATAEEFPDMPKCKEFIIRGVFPKTDTALTLGAVRMKINDANAFRLNSTSTSTNTLAEIRCHTIIAERLVHTVGTEAARGQSSLVGNANILVGNSYLDTQPQEISTFLSDTAKRFPIGTQLYIYGKVEG